MLARLSPESNMQLNHAKKYIQSNDLISLESLLLNYPSDLPYFYLENRDTLLGIATTHDNIDAFDRLLSHLKSYSVSDKINTLLLTSTIVSHMEKHEPYRQRILNYLASLLPHANEVKQLTLCSSYLSSESELLVKQILDNATSVEEISFIHSGYITSRWIQTDLMAASSQADKMGMISLPLPLLIDFCASILTKTHLVKCNLYCREKLESPMELITTIIERNQKMQDAKNIYAKNKIYIAYTPIINTKIDAIESTCKDKANVALLTDKKLVEYKPYSFRELTRFFINPQGKYGSKQENERDVEYRSSLANLIK